MYVKIRGNKQYPFIGVNGFFYLKKGRSEQEKNEKKKKIFNGEVNRSPTF